MIAPAVPHRSPDTPLASRRHGDRFTDPIRGLETRGHDYRRSSRPAARPEGRRRCDIWPRSWRAALASRCSSCHRRAARRGWRPSPRSSRSPSRSSPRTRTSSRPRSGQAISAFRASEARASWRSSSTASPTACRRSSRSRTASAIRRMRARCTASKTWTSGSATPSSTSAPAPSGSTSGSPSVFPLAPGGMISARATSPLSRPSRSAAGSAP